jgi:hypothetical protein
MSFHSCYNRGPLAIRAASLLVSAAFVALALAPILAAASRILT